MTKAHEGRIILVLLMPILVFTCLASRTEDGFQCSSDEDCRRQINGSSCTEGNCTCPPLNPVMVEVTEHNSSFCLTGFNETGSNCTFDQQCEYDRGRCHGGVCGCRPPFMEKDGGCATHTKSSIVPIAVGIAIGVSVFGTLCLYLWLSRTKEEEPQLK